MKFTELELSVVEQAVELVETVVKELQDLELSMVGGGHGDISLG